MLRITMKLGGIAPENADVKMAAIDTKVSEVSGASIPAGNMTYRYEGGGEGSVIATLEFEDAGAADAAQKCAAAAQKAAQISGLYIESFSY